MLIFLLGVYDVKFQNTRVCLVCLHGQFVAFKLVFGWVWFDRIYNWMARSFGMGPSYGGRGC